MTLSISTLWRKNIFYFSILLLIHFASCKTTQPIVNVPPKAPIDTVKKTTAVKDSIIKPSSKTFEISLLLPLNFARQFAVDSMGNESDIIPSSLQALNFYEGVLLANDNLKKNKINLSVYDTDRDSLSLWKLLNSEALSKSDVVMAMLPNSWNIVAATIASARQYHLFLLSGNTTNSLNESPNTFLTVTSNASQCKLITQALNNYYPGSNTVIIYRETNKKETDIADLFYDGSDSTSTNKITKFNYGKDGFGGLKSKLVASKQNVLIIPSSDESYLSSLLTKLSDLKDYKFIIAGLPTWEYFESIDPLLLESLNTHIFNASFIDYNNEEVKKFRKQFLETYHADPAYSAFQGYDLINWIQSNKQEHKLNIDRYQTISFTTQGLNPVKVCSNCGFENASLPILKYKNSLLERVNR